MLQIRSSYLFIKPQYLFFGRGFEQSSRSSELLDLTNSTSSLDLLFCLPSISSGVGEWGDPSFPLHLWFMLGRFRINSLMISVASPRDSILKLIIELYLTTTNHPRHKTYILTISRYILTNFSRDLMYRFVLGSIFSLHLYKSR